MTNLGYDKKSQNRMVFQILENLDKNKDGKICFDEFLDMMTARISDRDSREELNDDELREMIERADTDGSGSISPDEFYNIMV